MMENKVTPSTNRTARRKSSSRKSIGSSASKLVRLMMQKEKQRKLNHYRNVKQKRADAFESRRFTNEAEESEQDKPKTSQQIENDDIDDNSLISLDMESDDNDTTSNNDITIRAAEPSETNNKVVQSVEVYETSMKSSNSNASSTNIGSRIGSSIANRFNSIKNSLKKIVSSSNRREIHQLTNEATFATKTNAVRSLIQHPTIKQQTNVVRTVIAANKTTQLSQTKELNESSMVNKSIINKPATTNQKTSMNLRVKEINNIKSNLGRSNSMNLAVNNSKGVVSAVGRAFDKSDSLKPCHWKNVAPPKMTSTILSSHNSSNISNTSTLSRSGMNSSTSSLNRPSFKLTTKIKYNDRDLYSNDEWMKSEMNKSKYTKLKENRKIAHMGSTASLY